MDAPRAATSSTGGRRRHPGVRDDGAVTSLAGVTSNAGLATVTPTGVKDVTSIGSLDSTGMSAPERQPRSMVENGAAT